MVMLLLFLVVLVVTVVVVVTPEMLLLLFLWVSLVLLSFLVLTMIDLFVSSFLRNAIPLWIRSSGHPLK